METIIGLLQISLLILGIGIFIIVIIRSERAANKEIINEQNNEKDIKFAIYKNGETYSKPFLFKELLNMCPIEEEKEEIDRRVLKYMKELCEEDKPMPPSYIIIFAKKEYERLEQIANMNPHEYAKMIAKMQLIIDLDKEGKSIAYIKTFIKQLDKLTPNQENTETRGTAKEVIEIWRKKTIKNLIKTDNSDEFIIINPESN